MEIKFIKIPIYYYSDDRTEEEIERLMNLGIFTELKEYQTEIDNIYVNIHSIISFNINDDVNCTTLSIVDGRSLKVALEISTFVKLLMRSLENKMMITEL